MLLVQSAGKRARLNSTELGLVGVLVLLLIGSKKWHEFCWRITERSNVKPEQRQFTFDAQWKATQ